MLNAMLSLLLLAGSSSLRDVAYPVHQPFYVNDSVANFHFANFRTS